VEKIKSLIEKVASSFGFENCASHIELKIKNDEITIIEVSPRLGGDYITSKLVPLSTGINMEKALIDIALGKIPDICPRFKKASGIFYHDFDEKTFPNKRILDLFLNKPEIDSFFLPSGPIITKTKQTRNSSERTGYVILTGECRKAVLDLHDKIIQIINKDLDQS
jgi:carbamoyl-phosphate synthase large subunit